MKWSDTRKELEFIVNMSPVVVFKFGARPGLPVEYVSNNIIQFGYPPEEFSDYNYEFENIIYRDDLEKIQAEYTDYSSKPDAFGFTLTYRLYTKFGSIRWVEQRTFIIRNDEGNVSHYQGLLFDITDRKKAEEETALNLARQEVLLKLKRMGGYNFQEIIDYAREEAVLLTKSKVGYIAFPTPDETTLIMHSWSKSSIRECSIDEQSRPLVYPVHRTGLWGEAIRQRKPLIINNYQSPSSLKKGFPRGHVTLSSYMHVPIFDGGRIVIVIGVGNKEDEYDANDIFNLMLLMQGLWEVIQKKRLEESLKERSAELADHYAKLRSISMIPQDFLKDIENDGDSAGKSSDHYLRVMEDEVFLMSYERQQSAIEEGLLLANRIKHLTDSMFFLSMGGGNVRYENFTKIDFNSLIEHVSLNTILLLRNKNVVSHIEMPDEFPSVLGEYESLEVVFTTLIENACLNSPAGGKISLTGEIKGDFFEVRISDSGPDLDEASLPYLFQSITFVGSGHFHANRLEGAESGLYVAKIIIHKHGGDVWGERNPEGGSVFVVKMPILNQPEKQKTKEWEK
ncbi:sensor histidine kinase [Methanimicrococcus blatticola]|uniref:histidine kinase n=1 Tax=Methanimicrococcus blatticola TaxID=91560 RepID=A0A484F287_9EURY|nr:GAF domain-containing sensor histidine kinase [Methanimicrococcus blatticola]MBZ3936389.1 GAF domain-containing protein [Methanimicrococcus blatticola]MCC2509551.1 GAF domain-containing protein [Methanimicrococcus blatticola]TDQ67603.1 PAS domain S-box-containing protein [Methanimicrococcus blatticola]